LEDGELACLQSGEFDAQGTCGCLLVIPIDLDHAW
jgi:hypothetical protein